MDLENRIARIIQNIGTLLLFGCMIFIFVLGLFTVTDNVKVVAEPRIHLNTGWIDTATKEEITGDMIRVAETETLQIRRVLPDNIGDGEILGFYDSGFHTVVFVNGRHVYESGYNAFNERGRELGAVWRMIPLDSGMSKEEIVISFANNTDETLRLSIEDLYIGSKSDLLYIIISRHLISFAAAALCIIAGIVLFIFGSNLIKLGMEKYVMRIYPLAIMTFFMGVWVYADTPLLQAINGNGSVRFYLLYFNIMLAPLALNMFYQETIEQNSSVMRIMGASYKMAISAGLLLYWIGFIHIPYILYIVHAYMLTIVIIAGLDAVRSIMKERSFYNIGKLLAFIVMVWFVTYGIIIFYFGNKATLSSHIGVGYLIFLVIVVVTQVRYMVQEYHDVQKKRDYKIMSSTDSVTNGNSTAVAKEWLEKDSLFANGKPWFIQMDILHFGSINLSLGWEYGNEILKGSYSVFEEVIDKDELLVYLGNARYGFIVRADRDVEEITCAISNKMREFLEKEWIGVNLEVKFAAESIEKGSSLETILDNVNMAYTSPLADYSAKSNCYYYTDACKEQIRKEYMMENQIGAAIYNDEFRLYLQVIVDSRTNEVIGAESLVRWDSPMFGIIYPDTFIPVAEKSGQIRTVDLHIFRVLLKYLESRERRGGSDINVSVNVSKTGLLRKDFVEDYRKIIEESGIEAGRIAFEFSEALTEDNIDVIEAMIDEIHAMNCRVFLDNFFAGESNLSVITKLKFDYVKVDINSLGGDVASDVKTRQLIKGVIDLFHGMQMKVICIGVENREQRDVLRDLGADMQQGFFYSKPVDIDEFENAQFMNPVD